MAELEFKSAEFPSRNVPTLKPGRHAAVFKFTEIAKRGVRGTYFDFCEENWESQRAIRITIVWFVCNIKYLKTSDCKVCSPFDCDP